MYLIILQIGRMNVGYGKTLWSSDAYVINFNSTITEIDVYFIL